MVFFEDALNTVLSQPFNIIGERVGLSDSLGRVLAEDLFSDMDMPPFDKSAVDGFACRMADLHTAAGSQHIVSLHIIETIPAGTAPLKTIMPGECSKIMTGAMVPSGADCVIMVEDTEMVSETMVRIRPENTGTNVCYRGENIRLMDRVLQKGLRITPAHVAIMASVGAINPLVAKLPGVGIISTGDELVEPGVTPGIARIRNSNAIQLEAQVRMVPALPAYYGIVADEGQALRDIIELAMANNDVTLLTGGVSMGDFDFVPAVMEDAGIEILFKSIAIQPGKPTVFGRRNNRYVFVLPGNPVSSFVLFEMMVRPFLLRLMGNCTEPLQFRLPMGVDYSRRKSARKSTASCWRRWR